MSNWLNINLHTVCRIQLFMSCYGTYKNFFESEIVVAWIDESGVSNQKS